MGKVEQMKELLERYNTEHDFAVGDIVAWKPGLKDKRFPQYGEPVIVVALYPGEVGQEKEPGSSYYKNPIDLAIGRIDTDKDFMFWRVDKARFEPYQQ